MKAFSIANTDYKHNILLFPILQKTHVGNIILRATGKLQTFSLIFQALQNEWRALFEGRTEKKNSFVLYSHL